MRGWWVGECGREAWSGSRAWAGGVLGGGAGQSSGISARTQQQHEQQQQAVPRTSSACTPARGAARATAPRAPARPAPPPGALRRPGMCRICSEGGGWRGGGLVGVRGSGVHSSGAHASVPALHTMQAMHGLCPAPPLTPSCCGSAPRWSCPGGPSWWPKSASRTPRARAHTPRSAGR